jgi:hypothetical protein
MPKKRDFDQISYKKDDDGAGGAIWSYYYSHSRCSKVAQILHAICSKPTPLMVPEPKSTKEKSFRFGDFINCDWGIDYKV